MVALGGAVGGRPGDWLDAGAAAPGGGPREPDGVGGGGIYDFVNILPESQFRYNTDYGAMLVTASRTDVLFEFHSRSGKLIDQYKLQKP